MGRTKQLAEDLQEGRVPNQNISGLAVRLKLKDEHNTVIEEYQEAYKEIYGRHISKASVVEEALQIALKSLRKATLDMKAVASLPTYPPQD